MMLLFYASIRDLLDDATARWGVTPDLVSVDHEAWQSAVPNYLERVAAAHGSLGAFAEDCFGADVFGSNQEEIAGPSNPRIQFARS